MTFSTYISYRNIFFEMTIFADSVQCETISPIKFLPIQGVVDFLRILGAFRWENPNPGSCFYFKAVNLLSKQKRPTSCKITKQEKHSLEEKLADLAPLSSDKKIRRKTCHSSYLRHDVFSLLEEFVSLTSFEEKLLHRMSTE